MKKIICLFVLLLSTVTMTAQQPIDVDSLLHRLDQLKHTPFSFNMILDQHFTLQEQAALNQYFASQSVSYPNGSSLNADLFYALDIRNNGIFGTLNGTPPFNTFNEIATNGLNAFADDFSGLGTLYALSFDSGSGISNLVTVDVSTGSFSVVDNVAGLLAGHTPTGLSYNADDDIMYALSSNGNTTQLYTVNLITASITPVGSGTGNSLGIWLEIDTAGNAWMADITTDSLYSVNLTSGTSSVIGPLNIDINFAQEVTYDEVNDELVMAAYTGGGTGGIYRINTATGLASFIGETNALNAQFGMFSASMNPLSVEDNLAQLVKVYPNPMTTVLFIEVPSGIDISNIVIYDVLGRQAETKFRDGSIDVSALASGIYLLQLNTTSGTITQKLVKQ